MTPDVAVFAKAIGNGYPIAAVIGCRKVMEAAQRTFVSSTYWTERVGPVAALATLAKFAALDGPAKLIAAGRRVQTVWRDAADESGLAVTVGHEDMPPMSHLTFEHPQAQAIRTLYTQLMLDQGYLDNGTFYATTSHTQDLLDRYEHAVRDAFRCVAMAIEHDTVLAHLRGPIAHTGFARLTSD